MPAYTDFLELILPEFEEFVDNWNEPVNQNFETINDWTKDLHDNLVGVGTGSTWAQLRGDLDSLATRLAVSIDTDGTILLSGSPDFINMAASATRGQYAGPRERLDDNDFEIYDARQPVPGSRTVPLPIAGPSAGSPPERLDSAIALRTADFGANTGRPISGPHIPWSPGLVVGGGNPLITGVAIGRVRITADATPAIFNIDGYIFRLREILDFDWSLLAPANNTYIWIYVERTASGYNNANFKYTAPAGPAAAAKDLRKLQSGSDGITSGSTFSSASATFNTAAFGKVKPGDVLVITDTAAAGSYVVDALDGVTPDTKFTIKGIFKADIGSENWYILDAAHPNIGAVATDTTRTTLPAFVNGRVYIARAKHQTGGNPIEIVTFTAGGVYDSGWVTVDASIDFPYNLVHDLGTPPSDVTIQFRADAASNQIYPAIVRRQLVTSVDESNTTLDSGDTKFNTFLVPSAYYHSSELDVTIALLNASTSPAKASALFTDSGGTDHTTGQMRVIARR